MFERYTETAKRVIFFARYEASQFGTSEILPEHLLLGILREDKTLTRRILGESPVVEAIRKRIESEIPRGEKTLTSVDLPVSLASKRILAYAAEEAERLNHKQIAAEHMLAGILREKKTLAAKILTEHGITVERLREEAKSREEAARPAAPPPSSSPITPPATARPLRQSAAPSDLVLRDLTELAHAGQLTPLIGRERELERVIQILSRRTRRNPVLIGEPGAGKGAIVEGLAHRIASGAVPPGLVDRKLVAIDVAALLPPRRGQELPGSDFATILFIERLFDIGAAGYSWGVLEAMRVLEPMLARGGLQVIATGTPAGYRELMDKAA
ncbi:MAG: ATP-dependent Clp protease ATP-binding subunit, partial [Acidobacteriia bacterium]|nr:ATP-dependent Clp protease ATP-binding subunit [Terriglobia bacterium]